MSRKHSIFDPIVEETNEPVEEIKVEPGEWGTLEAKEEIKEEIKPEQNKIVRVEIDNLNIRKGPSLDSDKTGRFIEKGSFEITEEKNGFGKLADGRGWICLKFTK